MPTAAACSRLRIAWRRALAGAGAPLVDAGRACRAGAGCSSLLAAAELVTGPQPAESGQTQMPLMRPAGAGWPAGGRTVEAFCDEACKCGFLFPPGRRRERPQRPAPASSNAIPQAPAGSGLRLGASAGAAQHGPR